MPSWRASNSVWTKETIPLKHVAFLPVLPHPATDYNSIYSQMKNFVEVCSQLNQDKFPIYCDEKVYAIAKEIQLQCPQEFSCLFLCLGTFHCVKNLLKCNGKSLEGSGAELVWLNAGVHGPSVIEKSILHATHYSCALEAQSQLAEATRRLQYKEFFKVHKLSDYSAEINILQKLKDSVANGNIADSQIYLEEFRQTSQKLSTDLDSFIRVQSAKNENFKFWSQFLNRYDVAVDLIRADHEGLWDLHLDATQRSLYEYTAWSSTNYIRWASVYLEEARNLKDTAPVIYENFKKGSFAIKDHPGRFIAVGGDQKLEQTINASSKSCDAVIGHSKQKQFIAEWNLIYHETTSSEIIQG